MRVDPTTYPAQIWAEDYDGDGPIWAEDYDGDGPIWAEDYDGDGPMADLITSSILEACQYIRKLHSP
jgi:hypothetical protein